MTPSWDHIRSLLAVLSEGSLSAAARKLRLSQPTIGRHIDELEQQLGAALFTRSPSGLDPTDTALALRPQAEAMAAAADSLRRVATGEASGDRGTVRLTASEVVGVEVLPSILAEFRELHPDIAVELVVSNRNEDLLRRNSDIAVRMVPPTQAALVQKRIGTIEIGFHARADYLERHGTPEMLEELRDHALIGFDEETPVVRSLQQSGLIPARERFSLRTDSDLAHLAAIRAGYGIGMCQVGIARRDPALRRVLASAVSLPLDGWLAMHEDLRRVRRMRLLFDHLAEGLGVYIAGQHLPA
ncbi:LysR family transcriptional regulator [Kaistia algarum]|uniref:LysR family transcriptional regulator n=1 Tax=Kaistia algarum TaxID=2083279 RepID=UPI000CE90E52|nr:LysR family transcriptional regulator [Kaistia algarum]MCX5516274.1 LysR family transcriptional regulator [Kaistia algarum]PPE78803.1 LysR family transcriptional regulator [Kaistia algarum]